MLILCIFVFIFRREEIKEQLDRYRKLWPQIIDNEAKIIEDIEKVLHQKYRSYLSVFRLEQDTSLTNTIFGAVLQCNIIKL
jgi:hypothetical protein